MYVVYYYDIKKIPSRGGPKHCGPFHRSGPGYTGNNNHASMVFNRGSLFHRNLPHCSGVPLSQPHSLARTIL